MLIPAGMNYEPPCMVLLAQPLGLHLRSCACAGGQHSSDAHCYDSFQEVVGWEPRIITDRLSLALSERAMCNSEIKRHEQAGVTFRDREFGTFLTYGLKIGRDTAIGVGVQIYGKTTIGRCVLGPFIGHCCLGIASFLCINFAFRHS